MFKVVVETAVGIKEIVRGMLTIGKHAFREPITVQYPEQKQEFNIRLKGRPALTVNESGKLICIGCKACQKVCPCVDLIYIETQKDENNKQQVEKFTIDLGRCIFCGNCADVCPKSAIVMSDEFEISTHSREALVFDKEKLALSPEKSKYYIEELAKDI
ncbi:MAG: NADH-quinone oxidoreductase subunit I [bacterium]